MGFFTNLGTSLLNSVEDISAQLGQKFTSFLEKKEEMLLKMKILK